MVFIYLQKNCDLCLLFCFSSFSVSIPMSRRVTDPCQVNPCQNGGVCLPIPHSPSYECSCPESFSGRLCEQSGWNYSSFKFTRRCVILNIRTSVGFFLLSLVSWAWHQCANLSYIFNCLTAAEANTFQQRWELSHVRCHSVGFIVPLRCVRRNELISRPHVRRVHQKIIKNVYWQCVF